jgi:glycosyltransferase involved in cell wall biosynthesis
MALSHLVDVPMLTTLHNNLPEETRFIWSNYNGWYNAISGQQLSTLPAMPNASCAGVVHNAIDVDSFPFRPEKDGYFLFIGRITQEKAPHLAIEAARRLGVKLIIAGKVAIPEEHRYFEQVLKPMVDGTTVEFVGEADADLKRELYSGARALLLPLQWDEPFGLVMIEAMACGTPAVVFDRGAAPEIVLDGETGFLVDDVDEMVAALRRLDSIDPWRCREHVESRFSPAALADNYLALYEKILGVKEPIHDRVLA